jgi:hypothetical protein
MTIPFGPLRLYISLSWKSGEHPQWEALAAAGMDDQELARLNRMNTRDPVNSPWAGMRLLHEGGGGRYR